MREEYSSVNNHSC